MFSQAASHASQPDLFLDLGQLGLAELDLSSYGFLVVNRQLADLFGYTQDQLLGLTLLDVTHPGDRKRLSGVLGKLRRGAANQGQGTYRGLHKSGKVMALPLRAWLIDPSGQGPSVALVAIEPAQARRRVRALFRARRERMRTLVTQRANAAALADLKTSRLFAPNAAFCRLFGYSPEEVEERLIADLHPPALWPDIVRTYEHLLRSGQPLAADVPAQRKDGSLFWAHVSVALVRFQGRECLMGVIRDVTRQRLSQRALRRSEARFRTLAEHIHEVPFFTDAQGRVTYLGPQAVRYGVDSQQAVSRPFWEFVLPEDRPRVVRIFRNALRRREEHVVRFRVMDRQGRISWMRGQGTIQCDARGHPIGVTGVLSDITEDIGFVQELASRGTMRQEVLARELHDTVSQELAGLAMVAAKLASRCAAERLPEAAMASQLATGLQRAQDQLRQIVSRLGPSQIEPDELVPALRQLTVDVQQRYAIRCRFQCRGPVAVADRQTSTHLVRIAQEAVANAAKHARARCIRVRVDAGRQRLSLRVCDDGIGIGQDAASAGGLGLRIMRWRAGEIGAEFDVRRAKTGGTIVTCVLREREGL